MGNLHDIDVETYLLESIEIEPMGLEEEFIRIPSDLAYWNHKYAESVRGYQRSKFVREQVAARLHPECREDLMEAAKVAAVEDADDKRVKVKAKPPTVSDIESAVLSHPEYVEARESEIEAEATKVRLYGVVDAVRTKSAMLIQMGANRRAEMQGDPTIRQEARSARETKDL